jgi:anti-sigma factor ChrR (cupin superfamily)
MEPGARIEPHSHARAEQCLILEGDAEWNGDQFGPGDFLVGLPHERLPEFSTRHGNLLLIVGSSERSPFFNSPGI